MSAVDELGPVLMKCWARDLIKAKSLPFRSSQIEEEADGSTQQGFLWAPLGVQKKG